MSIEKLNHLTGTGGAGNTSVERQISSAPISSAQDLHHALLDDSYGNPANGSDFASQLQNTSIIIMRHGEKTGDPNDPNLDDAGYARANMLATWVPQQFGRNPDFIFAAADSKHSNRPVETMTPLHDATGVALNSSIRNDDYQDLADVLNNPAFDGKDIAIDWHHGNIPSLAEALGASPSEVAHALGLPANSNPVQWPGTDFDDAIKIDYGPTGTLTVTGLHENFKPPASAL